MKGEVYMSIQQTGVEDRSYWLSVLDRIARPVLSAVAEGRLKRDMPVGGKTDDRHNFTYLEALARTLTGISPWLELGTAEGSEELMRSEFAHMARKAIEAGTDPDSPDFFNFTYGGQPVVDAAFLAHAVLRAPVELWEKLGGRVKGNLASCLKATRSQLPCFNNWLLFAAMIEAALFKMGEDWDIMRVDYALRQHMQWYKGDGVYGDGPQFHWDYYNSFVIHPMLLDIVSLVSDKYKEWEAMKPEVFERAQRYAAVLERMISPEGTFPPIGRSLAYRFGAFQLLGQMALSHGLPEEISPAQVRCALTAVIGRMIEMDGTFDDKGWLRTGFCGSQPDIGERYISTGSLYLCCAGLLPLGLPASDEFWAAPAEDWTAKKIWSGQNMPADHAIYR